MGRRHALAWIAVLGLLGPGTQGVRAAEYQMGPAPEWVKRVPVDVDAPPPARGVADGVQYLLSDEQVQLDRNGKILWRHRIACAVNQRGAESAGHLSVLFDPSYQSATLHVLRVWRDGKPQDRLQAAHVRVLQRESELESRMYDGRKTLDITLEDVRPGDVVESAYSLRGSNPALQGDEFGRFSLQYGVPVANVFRRVRAPVGTSLQWSAPGSPVQPDIRREGGWADHVWTLKDVQPVHTQDDAPSWWEPYAYVEWSTFRDWNAVARWAEPLYAPAPITDAALAAEVARIRQSAATSEERIAAVLAFVQSSVRYLGIEMGAGSYAPRPADQVFRRRYGDCKDKVMLALAMLRELGISASPALVDTDLRATIDRHLPSPGVFNHVVLVARAGGRQWWLDPTRLPQHGGLERIAQANYGRALVVDAQETGPAVIPTAPGSVWRKRVHLRVDASRGFGQPAAFDVTSVYEGAEAEAMRDMVRNGDPDKRQADYLNYYRRDYKDLRTRAPLGVEDDEAHNRLTVSEHYEVPRLVVSEGGEKPAANVYARDMRFLLGAPDETARTAPLRVRHPVDAQVTLEIVLPDDRAVRSSTSTVQVNAFEFREANTQEGRVLRSTYTFRSVADHVLPQDLAAHLAHLEQARKTLGWTFPPEPPRDRPVMAGLLFLAGVPLLVLPFLVLFAAHWLWRAGEVAARGPLGTAQALTHGVLLFWGPCAIALLYLLARFAVDGTLADVPWYEGVFLLGLPLLAWQAGARRWLECVHRRAPEPDRVLALARRLGLPRRLRGRLPDAMGPAGG